MPALALLLAGFVTCSAALVTAQSPRAEDPVHLFILSGQSNRAGLDSAVSFTPAVTATRTRRACGERLLSAAG